MEEIEFEDLLKGFVFLGRLQAVAGGASSAALDVSLDDVEPSSAWGFWIGFAEISESDLVGEVGFFHGCLMAAQDFFSDAAVSCPKADAFLVAVLGVEDSRGAFNEVEVAGSEGF